MRSPVHAHRSTNPPVSERWIIRSVPPLRSQFWRIWRNSFTVGLSILLETMRQPASPGGVRNQCSGRVRPIGEAVQSLTPIAPPEPWSKNHAANTLRWQTGQTTTATGAPANEDSGASATFAQHVGATTQGTRAERQHG
jgi:hypothetical protein